MMKKLINFFKKLFRCEASCPKCKSNPCKCEPEIPVEHISRVEEVPEKLSNSNQVECSIELQANKVATTECQILEEKPALKKKRTYRKKKSETTKK